MHAHFVGFVMSRLISVHLQSQLDQIQTIHSVAANFMERLLGSDFNENDASVKFHVQIISIMHF